ncbi:putative extensin [Iris pallida]|uniref:Extensin n=1 Tax=Iris pallida TaxID=29817 RepID=A0AAX6FH36_IRIPA|nr:putative extensin [Iris pallida]KAJ6815629.1 putative extensin [Iris pallida]
MSCPNGMSTIGGSANEHPAPSTPRAPRPTGAASLLRACPVRGESAPHTRLLRRPFPVPSCSFAVNA